MIPVHTVDLNLLRVLDMLLEEENVTRAALRLELTQSAISRSLARLREVFGDELLLRTGRGMRPTARALELRPRLSAALADMERLVSGSSRFDPASARRRFRIAAVDYAHAVLLAPLLRALATEAPGLDWELLPSPRGGDRALETGDLDLSLEPRRPGGAGVVWSSILDERYTCLVWRGHPLRRLDRAQFAGLKHVMVAPWGRPGGPVDEALAATKARRRIGVQVPSFLLVPHVLVETERIATVPLRVAQLLAATHPVRLLEPPVRVPGFTLCLAWHEIHRHDPAHVWVRARLQRAARELAGTGPARDG
jgi:DNA-binding transcriptional LysR family regulator